MLIHGDARLVTGPAAEPITLAWAKQHLRFPFSREDNVLSTYLAAARSVFEEQTGRQCINATWEYALDGVPYQGVIELPHPPLASVEWIAYDDAAGTEVVLDADTYRVAPSFLTITEGSPSVTHPIDPFCHCGRVELPTVGATWPTTSGLARSLRIRYVAGYGATADVMPPLLTATLGMIAQHFHDRNADAFPLGIESLLRSFKWTALSRLPPTTAYVVPA